MKKLEIHTSGGQQIETKNEKALKHLSIFSLLSSKLSGSNPLGQREHFSKKHSLGNLKKTQQIQITNPTIQILFE